MKRIKYGKTLREISQYGIETFYSGNVSKQILNEIQRRGSILNEKDFQELKIDFQKAIEINLNNSFTAFTSSLPSSGPILCFILNIMIG